MKKFAWVLAVFCGAVSGLAAQDEAVTPQAALDELMAGNQRYISGKLDDPNQGMFRRGNIAEKQEPFAVIVSCSDSRVPPEIVFDRGLAIRLWYGSPAMSWVLWSSRAFCLPRMP